MGPLLSVQVVLRTRGSDRFVGVVLAKALLPNLSLVTTVRGSRGSDRLVGVVFAKALLPNLSPVATVL